MVFIWIAPSALCMPGLTNPEESPELNVNISKLARINKDARLVTWPAEDVWPIMNDCMHVVGGD